MSIIIERVQYHVFIWSFYNGICSTFFHVQSPFNVLPIGLKKLKLNCVKWERNGWKDYEKTDYHKNNLKVIEDVFDCETTKALDINEFVEGNINYITRSAFDNGYSGKCGNIECITKGNCITVGAEGKFAFYQENDFVAGVKVYSLRNKMLNKYSALFITTLLNKKVELYSYGRARILDKIKEENIKLPVTNDNQIDWNYMENYIKKLPYADNI